MALDVDPTAPLAGLLDVPPLDLLAGHRLRSPGELVERANLVGEQGDGGQVGAVVREAAHASCSFRRAETSPRRRTFCLARSRGRNSRSQFEVTKSLAGRMVSASRRTNSTVPSVDSIGELRPSRTPATIPVSHPARRQPSAAGPRSTPPAA